MMNDRNHKRNALYAHKHFIFFVCVFSLDVKIIQFIKKFSIWLKDIFNIKLFRCHLDLLMEQKGKIRIDQTEKKWAS